MARTKKQTFPTKLMVSIGGEPDEEAWFNARDENKPLDENDYSDGEAVAIYELVDLRRISKKIVVEKA